MKKYVLFLSLIISYVPVSSSETDILSTAWSHERAIMEQQLRDKAHRSLSNNLEIFLVETIRSELWSLVFRAIDSMEININQVE